MTDTKEERIVQANSNNKICSVCLDVVHVYDLCPQCHQHFCEDCFEEHDCKEEA